MKILITLSVGVIVLFYGVLLVFEGPNSSVVDFLRWPESGKTRVMERAERMQAIGGLGICNVSSAPGNILLPTTTGSEKLETSSVPCAYNMKLIEIGHDKQWQVAYGIFRCQSGEYTYEKLYAEYKGYWHPIKKWCEIAGFKTSLTPAPGDMTSYWIND